MRAGKKMWEVTYNDIITSKKSVFKLHSIPTITALILYF